MTQDYPPSNEAPPSPAAHELGEAQARQMVERRVTLSLPRLKPVVTCGLLGLSITVYLLQVGSEFLLGADLPAAFGLKVNDLILNGQVWRLLSPMLLHGSILHLVFNMYALNIFGPGLERHFGHWRFLTLYLLGGFAGNVLSFALTTSPSLGSSTAIFGLLGAEAVFLYQNRGLFGRNARRALVNIIVVAGINLLIGLSTTGIDNWGHIGGLLGGVSFAWFGGPLLQVEGTFPTVSVVDGRESGDVLRAGVGVGVSFTLLAALIIYLRRYGL